MTLAFGLPTHAKKEKVVAQQRKSTCFQRFIQRTTRKDNWVFQIPGLSSDETVLSQYRFVSTPVGLPGKYGGELAIDQVLYWEKGRKYDTL